MGSKIARIEYYLPEKVLTNEMLEQEFPEWNSAKVEKKIGIRQRHIAADDETAMDMALKAAHKVMDGVDPQSIDFLLFCTQSPEYLLPTTSCIIQNRLGLRTSIGAMDFNLGCSGYVYGIGLAKGLISAGICKRILFLTGETYSKYISLDDLSNRSIFGDAGTATIIDYSDIECIGEFIFGTDGDGADNLIVCEPSARSGYVMKDNWKPKLFMNGPEIFNFTIETIPSMIESVLSANHLSKLDIDYYVLHQANKYILEFLISQAGLDRERCHVDMLSCGNTVSNTIPIALKEAISQARIVSGNKVLLAGFGVGYSWGSTVITV